MPDVYSFRDRMNTILINIYFHPYCKIDAGIMTNTLIMLPRSILLGWGLKFLYYLSFILILLKGKLFM